MTEPRKSAPPASFEVPDLDLGALPRVSRPRAARSYSGAHALRARTDAAPDPEPYLGAHVASLDADFELDDAIALEAVAPSVDTAPWPLGYTNQQKLVLPTQASIAERAGYGSTSAPFYLAPAYTWRVWNQRRTLALEIVTEERELATRESERDRLLVELALSLKGALEKQDRFRGMLAELAAATQAVEGHERSLASTNAAIGRELEAHDGELARLETTRSAHAQVVAARTGERDAKATLHQRANAKVKRVQIEIRNATDKGRALVGPQGGALPPELARQLSELSSAEAALVRELAPHTEALAAANAALQAAEQPLAETERALDAIRRQKQQLVQSTRQKVESESSRVKGAAATHTDVAKRIGLAVLDLKGSIPVDRAVLNRIQAADDRVDAALLQVEKSRLALDAYDRTTYGLGLKVALSPIALLLALMLLRAVL